MDDEFGHVDVTMAPQCPLWDVQRNPMELVPFLPQTSAAEGEGNEIRVARFKPPRRRKSPERSDQKGK